MGVGRERPGGCRKAADNNNRLGGSSPEDGLFLKGEMGLTRPIRGAKRCDEFHSSSLLRKHNMEPGSTVHLRRSHRSSPPAERPRCPRTLCHWEFCWLCQASIHAAQALFRGKSWREVEFLFEAEPYPLPPSSCSCRLVVRLDDRTSGLVVHHCEAHGRHGAKNPSDCWTFGSHVPSPVGHLVPRRIHGFDRWGKRWSPGPGI